MTVLKNLFSLREVSGIRTSYGLSNEALVVSQNPRNILNMTGTEIAEKMSPYVFRALLLPILPFIGCAGGGGLGNGTSTVVKPAKTLTGRIQTIFGWNQKEGRDSSLNGGKAGELGRKAREGGLVPASALAAVVGGEVPALVQDLVANGYIIINSNGQYAIQDTIREMEDAKSLKLSSQFISKRRDIFGILKYFQGIPSLDGFNISAKFNQEYLRHNPKLVEMIEKVKDLDVLVPSARAKAVRKIQDFMVNQTHLPKSLLYEFATNLIELCGRQNCDFEDAVIRIALRSSGIMEDISGKVPYFKEASIGAQPGQGTTLLNNLGSLGKISKSQLEGVLGDRANEVWKALTKKGYIGNKGTILPQFVDDFENLSLTGYGLTEKEEAKALGVLQNAFLATLEKDILTVLSGTFNDQIFVYRDIQLFFDFANKISKEEFNLIIDLSNTYNHLNVAALMKGEISPGYIHLREALKKIETARPDLAGKYHWLEKLEKSAADVLNPMNLVAGIAVLQMCESLWSGTALTSNLATGFDGSTYARLFGLFPIDIKRDPSGYTTYIKFNVTWGLGPAIVEGKVDCDIIEVATTDGGKTWKLLGYKVGQKEMRLVYIEKAFEAISARLSEANIRELASLYEQVENPKIIASRSKLLADLKSLEVVESDVEALLDDLFVNSQEENLVARERKTELAEYLADMKVLVSADSFTELGDKGQKILAALIQEGYLDNSLVIQKYFSGQLENFTFKIASLSEDERVSAFQLLEKPYLQNEKLRQILEKNLREEVGEKDKALAKLKNDYALDANDVSILDQAMKDYWRYYRKPENYLCKAEDKKKLLEKLGLNDDEFFTLAYLIKHINGIDTQYERNSYLPNPPELSRRKVIEDHALPILCNLIAQIANSSAQEEAKKGKNWRIRTDAEFGAAYLQPGEKAQLVTEIRDRFDLVTGRKIEGPDPAHGQVIEGPAKIKLVHIQNRPINPRKEIENWFEIIFERFKVDKKYIEEKRLKPVAQGGLNGYSAAKGIVYVVKHGVSLHRQEEEVLKLSQKGPVIVVLEEMGPEHDAIVAAAARYGGGAIVWKGNDTSHSYIFSMEQRIPIVIGSHIEWGFKKYLVDGAKVVISGADGEI